MPLTSLNYLYLHKMYICEWIGGALGSVTYSRTLVVLHVSEWIGGALGSADAAHERSVVLTSVSGSVSPWQR